MGDMGEVFGAMNDARKERHRNWKAQNTVTLHASEFVWTVTNNGESFLFREVDKPKVDFYPSTGQWRVAGEKKTYRGGALAFLRWYRKL